MNKLKTIIESYDLDGLQVLKSVASITSKFL